MSDFFMDARELLTAYADGQLGEAGRRLVDGYLAKHPELRDELAGIHATQEQLRDLLGAAPLPTALGFEGRERLRQALHGPAGRGRSAPGRGFIFKLSDWRSLGIIAAAASFLMAFIWLASLPFRSASHVEMWADGGVDGLTQNESDHGGNEGKDAYGHSGWDYRHRLPVDVGQAPCDPGVALEVPNPMATQLDLPTEELTTEDPVPVVKGRHEAVAAVETGGHGAFMAMGADGGNGRSHFGDRRGGGSPRGKEGLEEKEQLEKKLEENVGGIFYGSRAATGDDLTNTGYAREAMKPHPDGDKGVTIISDIGGGSTEGKTLNPDQLSVDTAKAEGNRLAETGRDGAERQQKVYEARDLVKGVTGQAQQNGLPATPPAAAEPFVQPGAEGVDTESTLYTFAGKPAKPPQPAKESGERNGVTLRPDQQVLADDEVARAGLEFPGPTITLPSPEATRPKPVPAVDGRLAGEAKPPAQTQRQEGALQQGQLTRQEADRQRTAYRWDEEHKLLSEHVRQALKPQLGSVEYADGWSAVEARRTTGDTTPDLGLVDGDRVTGVGGGNREKNEAVDVLAWKDIRDGIKAPATVDWADSATSAGKDALRFEWRDYTGPDNAAQAAGTRMTSEQIAGWLSSMHDTRRRGFIGGVTDVDRSKADPDEKIGQQASQRLLAQIRLMRDQVPGQDVTRLRMAEEQLAKGDLAGAKQVVNQVREHCPDAFKYITFTDGSVETLVGPDQPLQVRHREVAFTVPCPGCQQCIGPNATMAPGHVQFEDWGRPVMSTRTEGYLVTGWHPGMEELLAYQGRLLRQAGVQLPQVLAGDMTWGGWQGDVGSILMTELGPVVPMLFEECMDLAPVTVPAGKGTVGDLALQLARCSGLQALPAGDHLQVRPATAPLDPTSTYGLAVDDFRAAFHTRPLVATAEDAQATFAFDADTASYDRCRMQLASGQAVDPGSVRVEHFVNAMPMEYPPATGPEAFELYAEAAPAPFAAGALARRTLVVSVGVVARQAAADERKPLTLTLCLDASGSMAQAGGLDRVRAGLIGLIGRLGPDDRVNLVVFDDHARLVASGVDGTRRERLVGLVDHLAGSGATNAAEGLALAYQVAAEQVVAGSVNRVLFVTDGATMAGEGAEAILERVQRYRSKGISLTIVGCGQRPAAADELERLADAGDGEHLFVADADQARRLFAERLIPARLGTLAKDAKIQVTWNPQRVSHHRLIGYEERRLQHHQFRDDRVDAGEISPETQASALFEVVLTEGGTGALGSVAVRYYDTRYDAVRELSRPLAGGIVADQPSPRLRLLACAAATGEWLRAGWWSNVRRLGGGWIRGELCRLGPDASPAVRRAAGDLLQLLDRATPFFFDGPSQGMQP